MLNRKFSPIAVALIAFSASINAALITDGQGGFGELVISRGDDNSSGLLSLPFDINFYGTGYSNFYVNNNGNISFNQPLGSYTPNAFPTSTPIIAPFWADVDTRCLTCGSVFINSNNEDIVTITWENVGYYSQNSDKTNTFQAVLIDRSEDTGNAGDFDIGFRYEKLEWTTGDLSGGVNGLGGTQAAAGFDSGNGSDFYTLPGSFTEGVLDFVNSSNLLDPVEGEWLFSIRNGEAPGSTPDNPILPVQNDDTWVFDFNITDASEQIFIDPLVAIGYDYVATSGPNFQTVELPSVGDDIFELYLSDGNGGWIFESLVNAGEQFDFGLDGVDAFRILGIETDAMLDPDDITAFVTGLTFTGVGGLLMTQTPISVEINDIPEPAIISLFSISFSGLFLSSWYRKRKTVLSVSQA